MTAGRVRQIANDIGVTEINMRSGMLSAIAALMLANSAIAADWVEVGADTEAKYYVDTESIRVDGENVSIMKRGVYTRVLTDNFGGHPTAFKETRGNIEIDCGRRMNRVTQIEMLDENGAVVWSSGVLGKQLWEVVRSNTHAEATLEFVCARVKRT